MDHSNIVQFMIRILIMFLAIPIHEASHAYAAKLCGDDTPEKQGRLTLNPFIHLDFFGSLLMIFSGFGWGRPVIVNPSKFKHRKLDSVLVALAGPLSNLIFAFVIKVAYVLLMKYEVFSPFSNMPEIIEIIIELNIYLAVFNIIPVPPLDGSKLLLALLPSKAAFWLIANHNIVFGVMLILLWFTPFPSFLGLISLKILSFFEMITAFIG